MKNYKLFISWIFYFSFLCFSSCFVAFTPGALNSFSCVPASWLRNLWLSPWIFHIFSIFVSVFLFSRALIHHSPKWVLPVKCVYHVLRLAVLWVFQLHLLPFFGLFWNWSLNGAISSSSFKKSIYFDYFNKKRATFKKLITFHCVKK